MPVSNDPNQQRKALEAAAEQQGITPEDIRRAGWMVHDKHDPYGPNPWAAREEVQWNEFEQSAMVDLLGGVYNELILGLGEGIVNAIPTIGLLDADEGGTAEEIFTDWIGTTSEWFDKQRIIYSDSAYTKSESFSDNFESGKLFSTIGEGLGFVLAMSGTGGVGATGKVGRGSKFLNLGSKAKSWGVGTAMMYSDLYDESINAGFSPQDASRLAIGTAGIVSLTEGAALEWIGKSATAFLPKEIATKALSKTFKETSELGVKDFWKTGKLFSKNLWGEIGSKEGRKVIQSKLKDMVVSGTKGAAIETGQEFGQTYIEDGLKEMYDRFITKTDHFKKEMFTFDQFKEAAFSGIVGGIIGGSMGVASKINSNVDSVYGFIDKKVKKGDYKALGKMYSKLDEQLENKKISPAEYKTTKDKLEDLVKFAEQTKRLNINDATINHQLYEAIRTQEANQKVIEEELNAADVPSLIGKAYVQNKEKAERITNKLDKEIGHMIENKEPLTKSKPKFEKMMAGFNSLYKKVINNNISDEKFEKELDALGIKSKEVKPTKKEKSTPNKKKEFVPVPDDQIKSIEKEFGVSINKDPESDTYNITGGNPDTRASAQKRIDKLSVPKETTPTANVEKTKEPKSFPKKYASSKKRAKKEGTEFKEIEPSKIDLEASGLVEEGQSIEDAFGSEIDQVTVLEERGYNKDGNLVGKVKIKADDSVDIFEVIFKEKKEDAIQERQTKEVPVQPETESSQEIQKSQERKEPEIEEETEVEQEKVTDEFEPIKSPLEPLSVSATEVTHDGKIYEISEDGTIRNKKSGNIVSSETVLGKRILNKIGRKRPGKKEDRPKGTIEKTYTQKKKKSKVPNTLDFGSSDIDDINDQVKSIDEIDPKNQIKGFDQIDYDVSVIENPELFNKITKHFKKIFPSITVDQMTGLTDKYGNQVLGQIVNNAITINRDNAMQSTQVHEFAEAYLDLMRELNPSLVKRGLNFIEGTKYHEKAKVLYKDYPKYVQLNEALVQAVTEKTYSNLVENFEGGPLKKFLSWMKHLWNKIKDRFTKSKGKSVVELMAGDLSLRNKPLSERVPKTSLRYQLGNKSTLKDPGMPFVSNMVNTGILLSKFDAVKNQVEPDASKATLITIKNLYDRYVAELSGTYKGDKIFLGNVYGPDLEQINNNDYNENLNSFFIAFKNSFPNRWNYIRNSIESTMSDVAAEEVDHSKIEIKPTAGVSANTRTIISNILDYDTGSPISKENVLRTILSVNNKANGSQEFIQEMKRKAAAGDLVAQRMSFILDSLTDQYSNPIIRDLFSLEQIKYTSTVLMKDDNGNTVFRKRIVNQDYNQEETVNRYADMLLRSAKGPKLNKHINSIRAAQSEQSKITAISNAIEDMFGITDFDYQSFKRITGYKYPFLRKMIQDASRKLNNKSTRKDVIKEFKNFLKLISIAESDLDVLQPNFVNTLGNRVTSIRSESNFSIVRKKLNNPDYVKRLKNTSLYKNNPIVQAIFSGMNMEMSIHDAVSNVVNNKTDEYSNQSTIDNKLNGLLRFALSQATNSKKYDQWIGVTADRSYQTFFTAKRHGIVDTNNKLTTTGKKLLDNLYERDKQVIESLRDKLDQLDAAGLRKFQQAVQNMTINNVLIENGKLVVKKNQNPIASNKYQKDIKKLVSEIDKLGLREMIEKQSKTPVEALVNQFFWNDYVNRKSLEDLYTGPLERHIIKNKLGKLTVKDISEPIKRMGLANSVGTKNEIDKPVRVIYIDTKEISDSFSFNGSYLQIRLKELGGDLDPVGPSVKDSFFQVDHFNEGKTISMKMSTLGLERKTNQDGDYIGNNFNEFTPNRNSNNSSISNIGDAIIAYENWIEEDNPYVKIVDTDVIKNEIPDGAEVMSVEDFLNYANEGKFEEIEKRSPAIEFENYRTAFNLHKDISTVPLEEQEVRLGTQFTVIASNNDSRKDLDQIDEIIVESLQKQLGNIPNELKKVSDMIQASLMHADETQSTFTKRILETIVDHNVKAEAYKTIKSIVDNKVKDSMKQVELIEEGWSFVDEGHPMHEILEDIKEDLIRGRDIKEIESALYQNRNVIKTFDHPNIKFLMENTISSQLTKNGINSKIPGNFLRVIPDFNEDLEFHNPATGKISDIAVPWSMFANSKEEAEQMLEESGEEGLKTIAVRIPTSGNTMIFAAKVKYFIDGESNNVSVPKQFIEVSDSDHDADKLFVYRQEIDNSGNVVENERTKLFNEFYKRVSSPEFINRTLNESVDVKKMRERVESVIGKIQDVEKSIRTLEGSSEVANAMKDGLTGVGIFAVAVKSLSVMHQSNVKIKKPIEINLGDNNIITVDKIDINALEDTALYLQAALDNAKEMVLGFSGVTKENMGEVAAMLISGMKVEQITKLLNDPKVKLYNQNLNAGSSLFSLQDKITPGEIGRRIKLARRIDLFFENSTVLNENQRNSFESAVKDDSIGQPINTELEPGLYRTTVNPIKKKGGTRYFDLSEVNGKKLLTEVNPYKENEFEASIKKVASINDPLGSYFKIQSISKELSRITPIVQLDAGLENNGYDNYMLQEKIDSLYDEKSFKYFDITSFLDRIRYDHYISMNKTQRDIEETHFLTEQSVIYEATDNVYKSIANHVERSSKSVKVVMDETIQTMYAQKMLSPSVKKMNQKEIDVWYKNFTDKIKAVKDVINGVESSVGPGMREKVEKRLKSGKPLKELQSTYDKMVQEEAAFGQLSGTIELNNGETVLVKDYLKDNVFLKFLEVNEIDGQKKVNMKKTFRGLSELEQKEVNNSYNDLVNVLPNFAQEILDYQLLTNGLNDKIGSYAALFPDNIHINYLEELSKRTQFREGVSDVQQKAFAINAALKFVNELETGSTDMKSDLIKNQFYRTIDNELLIAEVDAKTNKRKLVKASKYGSFMTNGTYYKLGDFKEYAKLNLEKETVSEEELRELKKCLRNNG